MTTPTERTMAEQVRTFSSLFKGRQDVYGTLDPVTGRGRLVKAPVTPGTIQAHLEGKRRLGLYVLVRDSVHFLAVDFDKDDPLAVQEFVAAARRYGIPAYVERSKSKGFHVWTFFRGENGVSAAKARLVARHLLEEIEEPHTEVFPKQDTLDEKVSYGNFIYLPLFNICHPVFNEIAGQERNVFLEWTGLMRSYPDQWAFLESVQRIPESVLDEIIQVNDLGKPVVSVGPTEPPHTPSRPANQRTQSYGLPPCAQRMLNEGVTSNQRSACFRLGVQIRKTGLPYDLAVHVLKAWAQKNHPEDGKSVISEREIVDQTAWAYAKFYQGCGCEEPAVARFCDPSCPLHRKRENGVKRADSGGAAPSSSQGEHQVAGNPNHRGVLIP